MNHAFLILAHKNPTQLNMMISAMTYFLNNSLRIIRRFKFPVALNLLGLSVAYGAFMVIMTQIHYDYSFDRFHKDSDKIFRLEYLRDNSPQAVINRPFAEHFFDSSPHILVGALTRTGLNTFRFYVEKDGERHYYEERCLDVNPSFFELFSFDFFEGSADGFLVPGNVVIPLSLSRKLFEKESAIGKQIVIQNWGVQTILAVYRDFPDNTSVENVLYNAIQERENKEAWGNFSYQTYIRVNEPSNVPLIIDNFKRNFKPPTDRISSYDWEKSGINLRLTSLKDLHYIKNVSLDNVPKGIDKQLLLILFIIALAIIAIAGINFVNFNTALASMRIKSINTHRIFGAGRLYMMTFIFLETVIISILSCFIAIIFYLWFLGCPAAKFVDAVTESRSLIVGGIALMALLVGLFAGLYPARYMTSFALTLAIKGSYGMTPAGKKLRNTMMSFQFIASFALIIVVSFMYLQNNLMQNMPLGFDKDEIITANIWEIQENREVLENRLKLYSGIEDVTYSESLLSSSDRLGTWEGKYQGEQIDFVCFPVHYNFLKVMGFEITEGRDFRWEDKGKGVFVFNETARNTYNLDLNTKIDGMGEVVGFIPDVIYGSFRNRVMPMAFYIRDTLNMASQPFRYMYIRVKANTDMRAAKSMINNVLSESAHSEWNTSFDIRFYDEILQKLYEKEISLNLLTSLFSLIAIFISMIGVFGLVVFDSIYRRKEVGIRKVLGGSTIGIISMFNKFYFRIITISFVIAAPLAWYAVNRWLQNFAYKTPMYWWVYLLVFVAVSTITICIVSLQSWQVANDNPVNSIKTE